MSRTHWGPAQCTGHHPNTPTFLLVVITFSKENEYPYIKRNWSRWVGSFGVPLAFSFPTSLNLAPICAWGPTLTSASTTSPPINAQLHLSPEVYSQKQNLSPEAWSSKRSLSYPLSLSKFLLLFANSKVRKEMESNRGSETIKFLCSYGGKILPRFTDGELRYVGGLTRVLAVDRSISFSGSCFSHPALIFNSISLNLLIFVNLFFYFLLFLQS